MTDIQNIKCKKTENFAKSLTFCNQTSNRVGESNGSLNLHLKFINNRFCAFAVQILLKMVVNVTICSNFEVEYVKRRCRERL